MKSRLLKRIGERTQARLFSWLRAYIDKHPWELPPQQLPEGGLFIQYEGEAAPRAYRSAQAHPNPPHEKDGP